MLKCPPVRAHVAQRCTAWIAKTKSGGAMIAIFFDGRITSLCMGFQVHLYIS